MPTNRAYAGQEFWNRELPRALAAELSGVDQELPPLEELLTGSPVDVPSLGAVLASLADDYRADLEGRAIIRGLRRQGDRTVAVAEPLSVERLQGRARAARTPAEVARLLIEVAGCYSPDYGVVGHPCHRWCPRWGRCERLQRPALHSLVLHLCSAYARAAGGR